MEERSEAYISAANMALKAEMAAAAVEEYETLRRWVVGGRVPPLSAPYQKLLARKLSEARELYAAQNGEEAPPPSTDAESWVGRRPGDVAEPWLRGGGEPAFDTSPTKSASGAGEGAWMAEIAKSAEIERSAEVARSAEIARSAEMAADAEKRAAAELSLSLRTEDFLSFRPEDFEEHMINHHTAGVGIESDSEEEEPEEEAPVGSIPIRSPDRDPAPRSPPHRSRAPEDRAPSGAGVAALARARGGMSGVVPASQNQGATPSLHLVAKVTRLVTICNAVQPATL